MLWRLIREYRQLHYALTRFYRRRARRPLTPQQEAERLIAHYHRQQEALRRLAGRR